MGNSSSLEIQTFSINNDIQFILEFIKEKLPLWYESGYKKMKIPVCIPVNILYDSATDCNYPIKEFCKLFEGHNITNNEYYTKLHAVEHGYDPRIKRYIKFKINKRSSSYHECKE